MLFSKIDELLRDWFGPSDQESSKKADEDYEESMMILIALKSLFQRELDLREAQDNRQRDTDGQGN
jgi:hypothetical protein